MGNDYTVPGLEGLLRCDLAGIRTSKEVKKVLALGFTFSLLVVE